MFCSKCGKLVDGIAHVQNDQLVCDECFNLEQNDHSTLQVKVGDESERATASQMAPAEIPPNQEGNLLNKFLSPGESILWKRSFSKGILKRHLTFTEVVTNLRAVCIDDEELAIVGYAQLARSEVSVENQRRVYAGMQTGYARSGVYGGMSNGRSESFGNVCFLQDGRIMLTLHNVKDPNGLKELVLGSKKSSLPQS